MILVLGILLTILLPGDAAVSNKVAMRGRLDGIWFWTLPTTPNGLVPTQSWSGPASAPDGDVYIAGMDHATNSALYRLHGNILRYVGDAKSASEAAENWRDGETAEKFHVRPVWHNGRVYVATLGSSTLDDRYLSRRGFHWYAYNVGTDRFNDLSAKQPGGVGVPHGGVIAQTVDSVNERIYAAIAPTGDLYRYDIASGEGTLLGHPNYGRAYVYPGRAMWLDREGRLYFTAGNAELAYYGAPYDPAIFNHVHVYDPATGGFGERKTWLLHDQRAIDAAQCFPNRIGEIECFLADNVGHVYKFEDRSSGQRWTYLGNIGQEAREPLGFAWVFHVFRTQNKIYIVTERGKFFEFDVATGTAAFLADLKQLEPMLADKMFTYGHGATVGAKFYFAAFSKVGNALLVGIDPERLKRAIAAAKAG
jgi:hypothetical protein